MTEGQMMFTVGPSPHWRAKKSLAQMNYAAILALLPVGLIGSIAYAFGEHAIVHVSWGGGLWTDFLRVMTREFGVPVQVLNLLGCLGLLAMGSGLGLVVESALQVAFRQPYLAVNGHGALIGLLIALMLPPTVPVWVLAVGVFLAILVGKQIYGGIGGYPFHPAMVGALILLLSWQNHVYPVGLASIAGLHWLAVYLTILGGVALIALGHLNWRVPLGTVAGVAAFAAIFHSVYPDLGPGDWTQGVGAELLAGHVMLCAFFVAPDTTTSPANHLPMILFGVGVGGLIMLVRTYGVWPDATPFAVLLMNLLNPILDRARPKVKEVGVQHG